ncbi:P63C domain-containing protein [Anaerofilum sp. BX8]|uniref:P63C domain-containing protein n=1 Tax=Anaerofilum hominis TaxID=2763016 RepID=A0A923L0T6_9FIRM|nr:P63C domain-containing protein [Anaerofilum hominis]MBC5580058.1 P63C domain-containing protein [Anaerofilum hominis]
MDVCKAYSAAIMGETNRLTNKQREITERVYAIMVAFAKVGLVAIIDEVTGYQDNRNRSELQKILEKYISAELMPWTKRFPDEFYKQMFRLKKWEYKGRAKSPLVGKLTNEFVYNYLPEGVLEELRTKNPKNTSGHRRSRHHQYLADTGAKHLDNLLQQEMALMKANDDWNEFARLYKKSMGEPYQISIEETVERE